MPNPKRRHSNTRTRRRRAHDGLRLQSQTRCPQCGKAILPHRVCPACGHYRGKQVVAIQVEEPEKKKK